MKHQFERVAIVLQGGGALGSYHVGAFKALADAGYQPNFLSGISIGAVNAAIIAGNEPDVRLERLLQFWETISWPEVHLPFVGDALSSTIAQTQAVLFGQPHFFAPRLINPYFSLDPSTATSFCDPQQLRITLTRFADFDLINAKQTRLTLGAVKVTSGKTVFFDNFKQTLTPEHVMASCALPPSFPPVEIDGEFYWDGACVSNTPLDGVLDAEPHVDTLVFMVDLVEAAGPLPTNMDMALARANAIRYASRSLDHLEHEMIAQNLRTRLRDALDRLPENARTDAELTELRKSLRDNEIHVVHVTQEPLSFDGAAAGTDFSRTTMALRAQSGYDDLQHAIEHSPWLQDFGSGGMRLYSYCGETRLEAATEVPNPEAAPPPQTRKAKTRASASN